MARLNPDKIFVEYRQKVTSTEPILGRYYTLTHSDETGELFLTIGERYAYDKINPTRDEVLGHWVKYDNKYYFYVYLYIDGGEFGEVKSAIRDKIFRKELPLALEAIRYGDRELFNVHLKLKIAPIIVFFNSYIPKYNKVNMWGIFKEYDIG
ncbi:hypothetical protein GOM49_04165 [Clostridium bovifaecis]|uniref:Staygreen protein domain-containing protein n=1 Tax=Clostridium bovifaecis TaxID=2184719 RepID=A0A6I6EU85_9CLOT|nr:hypothetical protein GOM49_04165 [Clostridium bovifaecis]